MQIKSWASHFTNLFETDGVTDVDSTSQRHKRIRCARIPHDTLELYLLHIQSVLAPPFVEPWSSPFTSSLRTQ